MQSIKVWLMTALDWMKVFAVIGQIVETNEKLIFSSQ